jgi:hypothetical protein
MDPNTWIRRLENPERTEEAITMLERLRCPSAIPALGRAWEHHNRWSKVLRVIIRLADQAEMVQGAEGYPNPSCPEAGQGPYWAHATPFLIEALSEFDATDQRGVEDAAVAAEALGTSGAPEAIDALISAATTPEKLRIGQMVRIAAIRALGKFGKHPGAVSTLVQVLESPVAMGTLRLNAAAANALGASRSGSAVGPLIEALYRISPIYQQVRMALTSLGTPAADDLLRVFRGNHAEVNHFAIENKFATDCDKAEGVGTSCTAPGNLRFKAAALLGDLRARKAVPFLMSSLDRAPAVAFYDTRSGTPGPVDHLAVLDALRKLGAAEAAGRILVYMKASSTSDAVRPVAIDVYSMLATDSKAMGYLAKSFQAKKDEGTAASALLAYARLVRQDKELRPIEKAIETQLRFARAQEKKAGRAKGAKKEAAMLAASGARGLAREYEEHRTRARVGILCGEKPSCYGEILGLDAEGIVSKLQIPHHRREAGEMPRQDTHRYRIAAMERALLEVAKMGKAGASLLPDLLRHADSTDRVIRQGVLLALIQVAPSPCTRCIDALEEVIERQRDQTTLDYLTADTRIVLNYFKQP